MKSRIAAVAALMFVAACTQGSDSRDSGERGSEGRKSDDGATVSLSREDMAVREAKETPPTTAEGVLPSGYDFEPPCAPPRGGWRAVDSRTATDYYDRALKRAERESAGTFGGGWVDPINKHVVRKGLFVLVMRYTDDPASHEREVRRYWGGPLCLIPAPRTLVELRSVRAELKEMMDKDQRMTSLGLDPVHSWIPVGASKGHIEGLQRDLDRRFGKGVVKVREMEPARAGVGVRE